MFSKLFLKLYQFTARRELKKQQKKKMTEEDKKQRQLYNNLRSLYEFVRWLNKSGLGNRKQRKQFWRSVIDNKLVLENILQSMIKKYEKEEREKLYKIQELEEKPKEKKKGYQPTQSQLNPSNPPQGGSGVPKKADTNKKSS